MKITLLGVGFLLPAITFLTVSLGDAANTTGSGFSDTEKKLHTQLQSDNPKTRRKAADNLGQAGNTAAAPYIIPLLKDKDEYVRQAAARALGELNAKDAVAPLIEALKDSDPYVRAYAAWALGEIKDPKAVDGLMLLQHDTEEKVRKRSSEALQKFKAPEALRDIVQGLIKELKRDNAQASRTLQQLIYQQGEAAVLTAFADPGGNEAQTIHNYLTALSIDDRSLHGVIEKGLLQHKNRPLVLATLADCIKNEPSATHSLYFISKLNDPALYPLCKDFLKGPPSTDQRIAIEDPNPANWNRTDEKILSVQSKETSRRRILVGQLAHIGCTEAADALLVILVDERELVSLRGDTAEALGKLKEARAVAPLIAILQNRAYYWRFRSSAAKALGDIRDSSAVGPLAAVLKNTKEQKWLRFSAAGALGHIGDTRAAPALEQAAKDKDAAISHRSSEALKMISNTLQR